jgi:hypothetical protein
MASKSNIISAINTRVGTSSYSSWRIGLTHDVGGRKKEWGDEGESVTHWTYWTADSLSDAQDIEAHFINKGMKGGTGGNLSFNKTVYVYIF